VADQPFLLARDLTVTDLNTRLLSLRRAGLKGPRWTERSRWSRSALKGIVTRSLYAGMNTPNADGVSSPRPAHWASGPATLVNPTDHSWCICRDLVLGSSGIGFSAVGRSLAWCRWHRQLCFV